MIILGIETSCDETAAAVLEQNPSTISGQEGRIQILSNIVASSASLQAKYGGIIPEQAAREQLKSIIPVIQETLHEAKLEPKNLDAIAVTYGPGLIGSLLVGVETAKTLSLIWQKPLIPVNHLLGHFYANWIDASDQAIKLSRDQAKDHSIAQSLNNLPIFPAIGLLVSGGHTDLVLFKKHNEYEYLGGTRDDAAGECFDKCARLLGLPYPGGPEISKLAKEGDPKAFKLPSPMIDSKDFDFSFSGLKTAVANLVQFSPVILNAVSKARACALKNLKIQSGDPSALPQDDKRVLSNMCLAIENAIVNVLAEKTIAAAQKYKVEQIIVAGGVAANKKLKETLEARCNEINIKLNIPEPKLCTDNGAMIASAAFFQKPIDDPLLVQANPNLSL